MKKMIKKASLALTLGMLTAVASADCSKLECSNVRVLAIHLQSNGDAMVQLSGNPSNLGCTPLVDTYVSLPLAKKDFNNLYAHLAAYQIMEQSITLRLDAAAKGCAVASFFKTG